MEIIIGSMPPLTPKYPERVNGSENGNVEAKILNVRETRRGIAGPSGMERRGTKSQDPLRGRVLTIMVPDVEKLPRDIETGEYKVTLRFNRK
ncbi:MAG: hypothetical protein D6B25_05030 [Desulfobulbaceae bacterium]|nr:MAG: hypothetical protein D6B25_05030 [Desulfobulbaceae bacterium]